ncbi:hypothetical protein D3C86_1783790 [compost metagenome]
MVVFCSAREIFFKFIASQIVGVACLPNGTLNPPLLFSRYMPLKQVLFKKISSTVFSNEVFSSELNSARFSK